MAEEKTEETNQTEEKTASQESAEAKTAEGSQNANAADTSKGSETTEEKKELTPEEKQAARTGLDTRIFLLVEDITKTVTADTKETIEKSLESGDQIGCFLDINLYKQIGDSNAPIQIKNVPGNKISVTVKIKDALVNKDTSFSRSYVVYRYHEGTVTKIPATYDAVSQTITFETDAFSVYAVGYSDTKIKAEAPKTGDGAPIGAAVLLLIASAAGAVFVTAKKTK